MAGFFHPGLTKYHVRGLIVPIIIAISPYFLQGYLPAKWPHVVRALSLGVLAAAIAYLLMQMPVLKEDTYVLQKAVLLGLLTAEVCIFAIPDGVPAIAIVSFFVFMYMFGIGVDEVHDTSKSSA